MTQRVRDHLGRFGIWRGGSQLTPELATGIEQFRYGTLWVGGSPSGDLALVEQLLDATTTLTLATGIVNIWQDDAHEVAASFRRIETRHPGRFLLGVGAGHREAIQRYAKPYETLVEYVDALLGEGVPEASLVLAALGPKVLRLAAERTAGAHPYLVTPEYTRQARGGPRPRAPPGARGRRGGGGLGRSSAGARCWRRSRRWWSTLPPSGRGPSAARGWRSPTWAWSTTPATCAGWAGAMPT